MNYLPAQECQIRTHLLKDLDRARFPKLEYAEQEMSALYPVLTQEARVIFGLE
jgi:hypothetical protein